MTTTVDIYLVPESTSPLPLRQPFHSLPATEDTRQLLGLTQDRRIDCPLVEMPALWFKPGGKLNRDLDGVRDPRWVLARLSADAADLSSGWYHTRLTVEDARKLGVGRKREA